MHPILLQLGPITLRTYGALVALAFVLGLGLVRWLGAQRQLPDAFLLDLATALIVAGMTGARTLYVLLNWEFFRGHPLDIFKVWEGGLVFYGGFLFAAAAGVWFTRRRGQPIGTVADVLAPGLALGHGIGRLGCFAAGCCYGRPTTLPWAVYFRHPEALAPLGIGLHPTQIYESIGDVAIAFFLAGLARTRRLRSGAVFWTYVLMYGILRYTVELVRGDDRGAVVGGLYPSQWIAATAIVVAALALVIPSKKHAQS
jgi:phosphatidylglycerol:prolipoprotein diacylglycerol transferase